MAGQPQGTYVGQDIARQCQNSGGFYVLFDEATEAAAAAEKDSANKDDDRMKGIRGSRINNGVAEWR